MSGEPKDDRKPWTPPPGAEPLFPPHPSLPNPWDPGAEQAAAAEECARQGRHDWRWRLFEPEDPQCGRCGFRRAISLVELAAMRQEAAERRAMTNAPTPARIAIKLREWKQGRDLDDYLAAGAMLAEARAAARRGEWAGLLKRVGVNERTARKMMALASSGMTPEAIRAAGGVVAAFAKMQGAGVGKGPGKLAGAAQEAQAAPVAVEDTAPAPEAAPEAASEPQEMEPESLKTQTATPAPEAAAAPLSQNAALDEAVAWIGLHMIPLLAKAHREGRAQHLEPNEAVVLLNTACCVAACGSWECAGEAYGLFSLPGQSPRAIYELKPGALAARADASPGATDWGRLMAWADKA